MSTGTKFAIGLMIFFALAMALHAAHIEQEACDAGVYAECAGE